MVADYLSRLENEEKPVDDSEECAEKEMCSSDIDEGHDSNHASGAPPPTVQASLYHEAADGFGQWPILIESGAIAKLRVLAKREPKNYDIVMKKLK